MLERVVGLARAAGRCLLSHYGTLGVGDATRKGGRRRDLVSRADLESEQIIVRGLPAEDAILTEESGERLGRGRQWLVDPLDGTVNFLHGIPFWAVSIAAIESGRLVLGVVHAPALRLTFTASLRSPVRANGRRVRPSVVSELGDAIVATGFPYARDTLADNNLDNLPRVGRVVGGLRRMGSAALDLAFVAAGHLDGFWELHLQPWDVAAGVFLVQRAGGRVTDFRGAEGLERLLFGRNIIATNGPLHEPLRALLPPPTEL